MIVEIWYCVKSNYRSNVIAQMILGHCVYDITILYSTNVKYLTYLAHPRIHVRIYQKTKESWVMHSTECMRTLNPGHCCLANNETIQNSYVTTFNAATVLEKPSFRNIRRHDVTIENSEKLWWTCVRCRKKGT